jgi:hypothetical protein
MGRPYLPVPRMCTVSTVRVPSGLVRSATTFSFVVMPLMRLLAGVKYPMFSKATSAGMGAGRAHSGASEGEASGKSRRVVVGLPCCLSLFPASWKVVSWRCLDQPRADV